MPNAWVALYTPSYLVTGRIDPAGRRLSDHLNDRVTNFVSVDDVTYYDLLSQDAPPSKAVSMTLRKEAVQLVVPEDIPDPLRPRVRTDALDIVFGFAQFQVRGHFHRQPGDSSLLVELFSNSATRTFFPVSDAEVRYLLNSQFDAQVPLVLVNTRELQFWALEGPD
jgi:hypothetical protein